MKYFLLSFFANLVLFTHQVYSQSYTQKQNYIWDFGWNSSLNFNGNTPVASISSILAGGDLAAGSVCDANGNLLFYTDGDNFYNRNNGMMPNGQDVTGNYYVFANVVWPPTWESPHGVQIIPVPGMPNKYYVFATLLSYSWDPLNAPMPYNGYMYYSVVDMSLNGGLGDVEAGQKGVFFDSGFASPIAGVVGNDCNYWLITHASDTNIFKTYKITSAGIDHTPVISQIGFSEPLVYSGALTVSPDRTKIALGSGYNNNSNNQVYATQLFDFDPTTGIVSNLFFSNGLMGTQIAFSPDNTKLYILDDWALFQYDLSNNNVNSYFIDEVTSEYGMRLGPDGKIYFSAYLQNTGPWGWWISSIDAPNLVGAACQYDSMPQYGMIYGNFPNEVPVLSAYTDTLGTKAQVYLCYQETKQLQASDTTDTTSADYMWQDSVTGSRRVVDTPGTYIVTYNTYDPCIHHIDTFLVTAVEDIRPDLGADTTICDSSTYQLQTSVQGATYLWSDGSTDSVYHADSTGTYWVQVSKDGCIATDSIHIRFIKLQQNLGADTSVCAGDPVQMNLNANVPTGATALWSTGSDGSAITIKDTGIYWVTVNFPPVCTGSDTINIAGELCNCHVAMPNAFTPNGDGKNDVFRPVIQPGCEVRGYLLTIYNRWGQQVFSSTIPEAGWDGMFHDIPADIGTYMYVIQLEAGTEAHHFSQHGDVELIR